MAQVTPSPLSGRRFEDEMVTDRFMVWTPSRSKLVEEVIRAARAVGHDSLCPAMDATYGSDVPDPCGCGLGLTLLALDASLDSGGGGE